MRQWKLLKSVTARFRRLWSNFQAKYYHVYQNIYHEQLGLISFIKQIIYILKSKNLNSQIKRKELKILFILKSQYLAIYYNETLQKKRTRIKMFGRFDKKIFSTTWKYNRLYLSFINIGDYFLNGNSLIISIVCDKIVIYLFNN